MTMEVTMKSDWYEVRRKMKSIPVGAAFALAACATQSGAVPEIR